MDMNIYICTYFFISYIIHLYLTLLLAVLYVYYYIYVRGHIRHQLIALWLPFPSIPYKL